VGANPHRRRSDHDAVIRRRADSFELLPLDAKPKPVIRGLNFGVFLDLGIVPVFLDVEDLAVAAAGRLEAPMPGPAWLTTGGVALHQVIPIRSGSGELQSASLPGRVAALQHRLSPHQLLAPPRGLARLKPWIAFLSRRDQGRSPGDAIPEKFNQRIRPNTRVNDATNLGVAELVLGLALRIQVRHLHREHSGEALRGMSSRPDWNPAVFCVCRAFWQKVLKVRVSTFVLRPR